jgi:two-component system invasion response regulator UvrY
MTITSNILLVDDHELIRRGLQQLLMESFPGVTCAQASTATEARSLMATHTWNLVVLDINLPDQNGLEFLAEIKRTHPSSAVLVLSAFSEEEFAVRSFRSGADGFLTKASLADEMLTAVRRLTEGGKYVTASIAETLASALGGLLPSEPHLLLSRRELEVLRKVAAGKSIKEIAGELNLSEKTISTYRSRISEKLGITTNVALARYALRHQLIS